MGNIPKQNTRGNDHASGFSSGATAPHCSSSATVAFAVESTPLAWPLVFAGPAAPTAACDRGDECRCNAVAVENKEKMHT